MRPPLERTVRWRIVANAFSMTFVVPDKSDKFLFALGRGADDVAPAHALFRPGVLAKQHRQCFLELSGRDALKVEDRDPHLETLGARKAAESPFKSMPELGSSVISVVVLPSASELMV